MLADTFYYHRNAWGEDMSKLAFVDVETTGLDARRNGIIQIALLIEIDGEVELEMEWKVQQIEGDEINEQALEIHGYSRKDLVSFPAAHKVKRDLMSRLDQFVDKYNKRDKFFFIGYNSGFDCDFMRAWFTKLGDKYFSSYFVHPPMDVAAFVAAQDMPGWLTLQDRKLDSVYRHYCPDLYRQRGFADAAHDALVDIRATHDLWKLAMQMQAAA